MSETRRTMTPEEEADWLRFMNGESVKVPYKSDLILAYLREHPGAPAREVANAVGCSPQLVYNVRHQRLR